MVIRKHVFVLYPWSREELRLELKVVKLVVVMVAPLKISSVETKILNLNLNMRNIRMIIRKNLTPEMGVVENAWKHFQKQENHVCVRYPSRFVKPNCLVRDVKYVGVLVVILVINPIPVLWDLWVHRDLFIVVVEYQLMRKNII